MQIIAAKATSVNTKSLINGSQNHSSPENPNAHILFPAPSRDGARRIIASIAKAGVGVPTVPDRLIPFSLSAFTTRRFSPPAVTRDAQED